MREQWKLKTQSGVLTISFSQLSTLVNTYIIGGMLKEERTIPFCCLVCVFKDSWEVNIAQNSSFQHLTKDQDNHKCFLLSLKKETQPPGWLSSEAEDLETAQQATSYLIFSVSSASVQCFCISILEGFMREKLKKTVNPEQSSSYQINVWGNKGSIIGGTVFS